MIRWYLSETFVKFQYDTKVLTCGIGKFSMTLWHLHDIAVTFSNMLSYLGIHL